jgi:signal transduction histidine kinase
MTVMNEAQTQLLPASAGRASRQPRRTLAFARAAGRDLAYLIAVLGMSIVGFVVCVTGVSVTVSLLVLFVGLFVWLGTTYVFRWTATVDRHLAGWLRRDPVVGIYRRPSQTGVLARLRTVSADPQTWKDVGWLVLNSILGFALATAALSITAVVLCYIAMPLWWWAVPDPHTQYGTLNLGIYTVTSTGWALLTTAIGLLLAPVALLLNHGVAKAHGALAAAILGPSARQRLDARVKELASTRAGAVAAATEQLERIERDLHDGAQARLVALAMELGMAEEELARDPDAARASVRRARDEALSALGELRDLSRGLRPAMLQERGLGSAIEALTQRSPVPATVTISGSIERTPEPVQTAAYFVVAEALTNAAKHSDAVSARVSIERTQSSLAVTVVDDGRGGANASGSGLGGLRKRVRALDGRLEVISPAGGPTVVRAELPCA